MILIALFPGPCPVFVMCVTSGSKLDRGGGGGREGRGRGKRGRLGMRLLNSTQCTYHKIIAPRLTLPFCRTEFGEADCDMIFAHTCTLHFSAAIRSNRT